MYLALREGNAIYRIDPGTGTIFHVAGTGESGLHGRRRDGTARQLSGPKGIACAGDELYIADTESHIIRRIDLKSGVITTVVGTGQRGDGPEPAPLDCALSRPHGVLVDGAGRLYVGDSEAHRIRVVTEGEQSLITDP